MDRVRMVVLGTTQLPQDPGTRANARLHNMIAQPNAKARRSVDGQRSGFKIGSSRVTAATLPTIHVENDSVLFVFPSPSSSATRTEPHKRFRHSQYFAFAFARIGWSRGPLLGNSTSMLGKTSLASLSKLLFSVTNASLMLPYTGVPTRILK